MTLFAIVTTRQLQSQLILYFQTDLSEICADIGDTVVGLGVSLRNVKRKPKEAEQNVINMEVGCKRN